LLNIVIVSLIFSLITFNADDSHSTVVCGEESFDIRAIRKALEMEKKPSPMATAVQVEVAKAVEIV
jgi:hypothetical protein